MRVRLERRADDDATVTLAARATFPDGPLRLHYPTRTGALLRVDGAARGAFDSLHETIELPPLPGEHDVSLEVERRSLPTSDLPSGDGVRWRLMLAREEQSPPDRLEIRPANPPSAGRAVDVPLIGHSHLDVAWLWTYDAARRKAVRTFATALRQMELDGRFVYAQSQPQLYRWVFAADASFADRVRARLATGWDASVAPMWVEPDLHAPSGESILRQFAHGIRWMRDQLGVQPAVAWLPDTFGFPSTFPMLAAHAGVTSFMTTKLQWNDTTRWPYPQFRWFSDDGSSIVAAVVDSYEGDVTAQRLATARGRDEFLIVGHGDGGGGVIDADLTAVERGTNPWTTAAAWFAGVASAPLPDYRGELYLETHRGTYTTHRDVKRRNAELERGLAAAEEVAAWCVAVRAPQSVRASLADDLRHAWQIVLRGQFHDVMAGTAIGAVYADVEAEHDRAAAIVARVREAAASILPRSDVRPAAPESVAPQREGQDWILRNAFVRARVAADGTIAEFAYRDHPKKWDAWNLDPAASRKPLPVIPDGASVEDGDLVVRLAAGKASRISMRVALGGDEPWLRVACVVAWNEDHALLRAEHQVASAARDVRYGQPHGTIVRTAYPKSPAEHAQFEVPAQRWAHVNDGTDGLAVFASDLYGWNANGGGDWLTLGTSLLRAPRWPDPGADRGEQRLEYALVPTAGASISALEHAWSVYAEEERVRLFTCDDPAILIVATAPTDDGSAVVVRVRECDGEPRRVALRCGGRMRAAECIDAVERPVPGSVDIADEDLVFDLEAYGLRSFRVSF
jgi:alpha-mannosidase